MVIEAKYKRMSDESYDDYWWRICSNKDLGIYNELTWDDVGEVLNHELNENYTSSRWRKNYQMMKLGFDKARREGLETDDQLDEMRLLKMELEMERKKVQTESVYYNRILREHSREEMLFERVSDVIKKVELDIPEFKPLKLQKNNEEWLLGFSDIHAYKYFESITNKYNKEILERRMNQLMAEIIESVQVNDISKLTILNGGDSFEGILRSSALQSLELGVIETVVEFQRWLLEWLNQLSKYVEIKYIHLISANHSETRPLGTRAGQFPKEDLEIVVANYVYDMCKYNSRIEVVIPDEAFALFNMAGYSVIAHHGHGIRDKRKYIERMSRKLRVFIDYGIFGHLHHGEIKTIDEGIDNDCEIIGLPSIIGTDSFADSLLEGAKPSALLFKFEEGKGRIQENKFILK